MLTRLEVNGFKNLVGVDVYFGPFTCVAGVNGVGKSNLFDAITFLSALADHPLNDAALCVRDEGGRTGDVRSLFHRVGSDYDSKMSFAAEMIVPARGVDDLGQEAKATITFLRYELVLAYRTSGGPRALGALELVREELRHIKLGDAHRQLPFPHKADPWRRSTVRGQRRARYFISTEDDAQRTVRIHQDGSGGRPRTLLASTLPRTALSVANSAEMPTVTLARNEMRSWQLLQLEPTALRSPDPYTAPPTLGADGSHLPSALFSLARQHAQDVPELPPEVAESQIYAQVANRLSELIDGVREVSIDRDDRRELLTLYLTDRDGTSYPARALSDGTLRFLALSVLEMDRQSRGLICLEEPENGIHPARIPAILQLLQDMATNPTESIGEDNPLRQVIINTHSPAVIKQVPEDTLLVASIRQVKRSEGNYRHVVFECLKGTWRAKAGMGTVAKGELLAYLNPEGGSSELVRGVRRVMDRDDLQPYLPFATAAQAQ